MTRRTLLHALPAAAIGAAPPAIRLGCQTNAWPINPKEFGEFLGVLDKIKSLEFSGFETTFRNVVPQAQRYAEAKKEIQRAGLSFLGVHIFLGKGYDPQTAVAPWPMIEEVIGAGAALGAERVILSGQARNVDGKVDAAGLSRKAAALNRAGAECAKRGMLLAYHNHDLEFRGGGEEMEQLLRQTDAKSVGLMFDAGHAFVGGADSVRFFERHHTRIQGMHLRDFKNGRQVPLGQGEFNLAALEQAAAKTHWRGWIVAEEERPNDVRPGDAVVRPAREHLRKIFHR